MGGNGSSDDDLEDGEIPPSPKRSGTTSQASNEDNSDDEVILERIRR